MKPKSDNLFHFTRSLDVLKSILKNCFQPRYCLEDVEWLKMDWHHIAYAMKCFCDIPLSRISEHTAFYGSYGLGLTKEWGIRQGLEPVLYIRPGGAIARVLDKMMVEFSAANDDDEADKRAEDLFTLLRFVKPVTGKMPLDGRLVDKEFFQENEWRYAPAIDSILIDEEFEAEKDEANEKALAHTLTFTPQDVKYIFVADDSEIPEIVDFIEKSMGHFPHDDIKILQSRIVSLKTIAADI
jgi:hypothetical protein